MMDTDNAKSCARRHFCDASNNGRRPSRVQQPSLILQSTHIYDAHPHRELTSDTHDAMRLTAELVHHSLSYLNPLKERELDLRGTTIPCHERTDTILELADS